MATECSNCKFFGIAPHDIYDGYCMWNPPLRLSRLVWDDRVFHPYADVRNVDTCDAYAFGHDNYVFIVPTVSLLVGGCGFDIPVETVTGDLALSSDAPTVDIVPEP